MKFNSFRVLAPIVAAGLVLSACGGGDGDPFDDDDDLEPTGRVATVVVSNASNPAFNGTYTTTNVALTEVIKRNPIGGDPEVCSFRFAGLNGPGGRVMDGDVRYLPGTTALRVMFVSIATIEFSSSEPSNASVDRANNEIDLTAKVFNPGTPSSITITGSIPMRQGRPEGC